MDPRCIGYPILFALALYSITCSVSAGPSCSTPAGTLVSIEGRVDIHDSDGNRRVARLNLRLCEGDLIRLGERSRAAVQLANNAVLRIDQNTTIRLVNITEKTQKPSWIELVGGAIESFHHKPWLLKITTPDLKADIDGTEFYVKADGQGSLLVVLTGRVLVSNDKGRLTLDSGEAAIARADHAPKLHTLVQPRNAVRWALYYPPILDLRPDEFPAGKDWRGKVRESIAFYQQGDLEQAFASIANLPETVQDPRLYDYRAFLLLAVGRVDEAHAEIERALQLAPNHSDALALQSIIALVQNQQDRAYALAQRAVATAPDSVTALIALSYAQQARFELQAAQTSLAQAVRLDPGHALAWARLAEIRSSLGRLDQALEAAHKATTLRPGLSLTQTVLGFAYLTQTDTARAKAVFDKAIALDQADPLPRLGLGLAKIRAGDLDAGTREIAIAGALDPNDAIVRSYLGKAYYEQKHTAFAEREYALAKALDPRDPTSWFYDAIAKQTRNQPVAALDDLQRSIQLNDGRAVYRSRLLLDSDLAARSASLGRIYSDLGFQQLALVEGWNSLNTDPSNFSAHRLLADTYAVLPRHEIARVSELLQAHLLQPLNMSPIQPRLAESDLYLISAQGPELLSFREFNPLFNRNGVSFQANMLAGENNTNGDEIILSGIHENVSFSVGEYHFDTDGFRDNADQQDSIANAFVQLELSPQTSVQAEYRYRNSEQGDLKQRFFPTDYYTGLTDELESNTLRLGGRHAFSPDAILLGSYIYQDADIRTRTNDFPVPGGSIGIVQPENAYTLELQQLLRRQRFNLQLGAGYFDRHSKRNLTLHFPAPEPFEARSVTDRDLQHFNTYLYSNLVLAKQLTTTLGLSYDSLRGDGDTDKDQINPKLGVVWKPFPATSFRAAGFRTLKRTLINDQTLEPTQVAGFNQFYDDANLTEAWRYGAAIDQKFTRKLFAGMEVSKRDLKVPYLDLSDDGISLVSQEADWKESSQRAYLFWTPNPHLGLSADYSLDQFDRDARFAAGVRELDTQRLRFGIKLFEPSGWAVSFSPTYWHQDGSFEGFFDEVVRSGHAQFWTVDASVSYRLPKRLGFISAGATNLFDEAFRYFEIDENNSTIQPVRTLFVKMTLALP